MDIMLFGFFGIAVALLVLLIQDYWRLYHELEVVVVTTNCKSEFLAYYLGKRLVYVEIPETLTHIVLDRRGNWRRYMLHRQGVPKAVLIYDTMEELQAKLLSLGCVI